MLLLLLIVNGVQDLQALLDSAVFQVLKILTENVGILCEHEIDATLFLRLALDLYIHNRHNLVD